MSLFWSFSIAGGYLPLILRQKGIDTSAGLNETYRNYVVVRVAPPRSSFLSVDLSCR
jgi:hypothetical protein